MIVLPSGVSLSPPEAARKSGRFWKTLRRERARTFFKRLWTPIRPEAMRRISGESADTPSGAANIWTAWSGLFSGRMSRQCSAPTGEARTMTGC